MVVTGHDRGPTKPPHRVGDSLIVGGNYDPADGFGPLNLAVDVFYQCLSVNIYYGFSGETSGIEARGDDRDGGIDLHQNTALHLSTTIWTSQVPFLAENLHWRWLRAWWKT